EDDIDISRGNMIVRRNNQPQKTQEIDAMICWLGNDDYVPRTKFIVRHTSNEQIAIIKEIVYKVNIETLGRIEQDSKIAMNDIARIKIKAAGPLMTDSYRDNRSTGSFILINP